MYKTFICRKMELSALAPIIKQQDKNTFIQEIEMRRNCATPISRSLCDLLLTQIQQSSPGAEKCAPPPPQSFYFPAKEVQLSLTPGAESTSSENNSSSIDVGTHDRKRKVRSNA